MRQRPLHRRQDPAAQARYAALKQLAGTQRRVLCGTPGTLKQRTQAGNQYWVREHVRVDGRKVDEYLGPAARIPEASVKSARDEIELARALAAGSAQLRLHGYQRIERMPAAVLEVLHNGGLTEAGLVLVGSLAYGALLNELGVIAPVQGAQDIDLARGRTLALEPWNAGDFLSLLLETGARFVPVPGKPPEGLSTSYKLSGADALAVDLLADGPEGGVIDIDELGVHARAVPLLEFLLDEPIAGVVLSPNQVIPVNLPAPERYVVHKLFSSQSRRAHRDRIRKDLEQAALLAAVVQDETPGAVGDVFSQLPAAGRTLARRGARAAAGILSGHHAAAEALLSKLARA
jgi:hypothetical protein